MTARCFTLIIYISMFSWLAISDLAWSQSRLDDGFTFSSDKVVSRLDPKQEDRLCSAAVFTNAGKDNLNFRISWMDATKSTLWLESE